VSFFVAVKHRAKGGEKQEFQTHIRFIRHYVPENRQGVRHLHFTKILFHGSLEAIR
jgi:hypothetical protein